VNINKKQHSCSLCIFCTQCTKCVCNRKGMAVHSSSKSFERISITKGTWGLHWPFRSGFNFSLYRCNINRTLHAGQTEIKKKKKTSKTGSTYIRLTGNKSRISLQYSVFTWNLFHHKVWTMKSRNGGEVVPVHVMKTCGRADIQLHSFLTSELDETVVSFKPRLLYTRGKEHPVAIKYKVGRTQVLLWMPWRRN
jgi:hypothetical protein